jgi:predicted  nucleic acid-binding Zn-ribbon protein
MSENMPANSQREASEDLFQNVEATLKQLRDAATPPPMPAESWWKRTFDPAPPSSHQSDFNVALVDALTQSLSALRKTAASQETRLAQVAQELSELRAVRENVEAFREHSVRVEAELRSVAANVRALQERCAALEAELAQAREEQSNKMQQLSGEQSDKIKQLTTEQGDIRRELSERIQHLLDEQRVCVRQLSLQASEEAVLADRARRATELKLEELARRVPPPPA